MATGRALTRFAATASGDDVSVLSRLDEAALCIAAHARGDADDGAVDRGLERLDALAVGVEPSLVGLEERLFLDLALEGDAETYDAPVNSYLDDVLERRRGLPITLGVITISVGRRVGLTLAPVAMPGHFLVRHEGAPRILIDCFARGRRLTSGDCEEIVRGVYGPGAELDLEWLRPVGPRPVLARMLANLAASASRREDRQLFTRVVELHEALLAVE